MKIAIPTNDGLTLSPDFGQAKGFLILTLGLGEIIQEEMRWNKLSDMLCSSGGFLEPVSDCQVIMVNNIGPTFKELLSGQKKEIIHTRESIITNAYVHYLENTLSKETNTCCCP
jgi:predicted Fe-Mo cluster-binding NifX family protein